MSLPQRRVELLGHRWTIEGVQDEVVDLGDTVERMHTVVVSRCGSGATIRIPSKINAVLIDSCGDGVSVVCAAAVVTSVEVARCVGLTVDLYDACSTVSVDLSESVTVRFVHAAPDSLVTSSASAVSLVALDGGWAYRVPDRFRVSVAVGPPSEPRGTVPTVHVEEETEVALPHRMDAAAKQRMLTFATAMVDRLGDKSPAWLMPRELFAEIGAFFAESDSLLALTEPSRSNGATTQRNVRPSQTREGSTVVVDGFVNRKPSDPVVYTFADLCPSDTVVVRRCTNLGFKVACPVHAVLLDSCQKVSFAVDSVADCAAVLGCRSCFVQIARASEGAHEAVGLSVCSDVQLDIPATAMPVIVWRSSSCNIHDRQCQFDEEVAIPDQFVTRAMQMGGTWRATTKPWFRKW